MTVVPDALRKFADSAYHNCSPLASRRSLMPSVLNGRRPIRLEVRGRTQSESPSSFSVPSCNMSGQGKAPGCVVTSPLYSCHCSDAAYAISATLAFLSALMLRSSRSLEIPALVKLRAVGIREADIKAAEDMGARRAH